MRLLHVISSLDPVGGGPIEALRQRVAALRALGHESEIVSLDAPDAPWLGWSDVFIHALGPSRGVFSYAPRLGRWLDENLRRFEAALVSGLWQYQGFAVR